MASRKRSERAGSWFGCALALTACSAFAGCSGLRNSHEANKIPQYGTIDPTQPRELSMVSMPPYVVERFPLPQPEEEPEQELQREHAEAVDGAVEAREEAGR